MGDEEDEWPEEEGEELLAFDFEPDGELEDDEVELKSEPASEAGKLNAVDPKMSSKTLLKCLSALVLLRLSLPLLLLLLLLLPYQLSVTPTPPISVLARPVSREIAADLPLLGRSSSGSCSAAFLSLARRLFWASRFCRRRFSTSSSAVVCLSGRIIVSMLSL